MADPVTTMTGLVPVIVTAGVVNKMANTMLPSGGRWPKRKRR